MWGLGLRVEDLGFRVEGLGFRVERMKFYCLQVLDVRGFRQVFRPFQIPKETSYLLSPV